MHIKPTYQLTYCTNIHPGADWANTYDSLKEYVLGIKQEVSPDRPFGLGLRLSNKASEELDQNGNLSEFKEWLGQNDLYVFTMNGFPYGNFHNEPVKDNVHFPDWTALKRLDYTKRLFQQLVELLPNGMSGGISTSPISYKYWHSSEKQKQNAFKKAAEQFSEIVIQLVDLEYKTEKYLHLDIEPEPDGLLENSEEVLAFFKNYLVPIASRILKERLDKNSGQVEKLIKRHITVCYDICHFSLAYEDPEFTFKRFAKAGIKIGKIQVSAALKIIYKEADKEVIWQSLSRFDEPTYLHQVTEKVGDKVKTYSDLPVVLNKQDDFTELRAHFHVPIFLERFGHLYSTQDHILKVIEYLKHTTVSDHLEIETYTWDVLPKEIKKGLSESIVREINWLKERL
ncbi:TIM barrel protein possibly involved in myo-inositol catabolism [hydrothermal vent metagenome]|uniref:TIM barrel protein possibly involved in myo-inositol catabolism n=1 Tax=hydrothermal vent metagenome TaxID=652676 RepID=A0A3B0SXU8_9ZZZZ